MKTVLVFPPASDPAHPPLGIAALAGYLRAQNREVRLIDLNLMSYEHLLSYEHLRTCASMIERRLKTLEKSSTLDTEQAAEYALLAPNTVAAPFLCDAVPVALGNMRSPDIYDDRSEYTESALIVRHGMELVSAAYYPVRWYARGFSMGHRPTSSAEVHSAIRDPKQNLFLPFYDAVLSNLTATEPDVIGISLNYYCQLIPALTLALRLKDALPEAKIIIGGGLVCFYEKRWEVLSSFRHFVDAWIPFEGELPFSDLLTALSRGAPLSSVPGVLFFEGETPRILPPLLPPDPSHLPPPSFDGLPLDRYLSPVLVLPYLTSRGCYWGKCAFCSHDRLYKGRFRKKSPDDVVAELAELSECYDCANFYFTDEAVPPATATRVSDAVSKGELSLKWFGEVRFEEAFDEETLARMYNGGCRMLMFGMESAVQRVLDHMCKGIDTHRVEAIIRSCAGVGIRAFVMFFSGFPTETREEAEETSRFIESLRDHITHVAFSNFILEHHTPVHREPKTFGIESVKPYDGEDLKIYSRYDVTSGMSSDQAISFLEDIRDRKNIAPLISYFALSRSHLFFLPPKHADRRDGEAVVSSDLSDPKQVYPVRRRDLVPRTFAFNLEALSKRTNGDTRGATVGRRPSNYAYSPETDKWVEVGEHGLKLLTLCDGRQSLEDILIAVGNTNRKVTLDFYEALIQKQLLTFEVHP